MTGGAGQETQTGGASISSSAAGTESVRPLAEVAATGGVVLVQDIGFSQLQSDVRAMRTEISALRDEFRATLVRVEPALQRIETGMSRLPGRWTVWGAVLSLVAIHLTLFAGYLATSAPKEFWLAVLETFKK